MAIGACAFDDACCLVDRLLANQEAWEWRSDTALLPK
jgi:hypothetical protein